MNVSIKKQAEIKAVLNVLKAMEVTALKNIIKTSACKYVMNSMSWVVYKDIRNWDKWASYNLNKHKNLDSFEKIYFSYFKYLTNFKQIFKNFCLIFLDINF